MNMEIVLDLAILFVLKAVDNLLSTSKAILIQRHRPILAALSVVISQIIFYRLIDRVSTSDSDLALYIVSAAAGAGTLLAIKISDKFSKERTFVNVLLSDDKAAMMELRDFLKDCKKGLVGLAEKAILDCLMSANENIRLRAAETTLKSLGKEEWNESPQVQIAQQINVTDKETVIKDIFGIDTGQI